MDKKKAMRITIDGYANTGKTLLAWKIAEFLKLHGVDGANITFFNDNVEQLTEDPIELERILNDATSRDMWKDMEVALVERTPPRLAKWAAKPETYSPVLMSNDHINLEMGRNKRTLDPARSLASMMGFADEMARLKEAALHPELTIADGEAAVSYSGTVLGHPVSIPARRLHSYGNYTPEELAKYKPQVHPTTGETREQMYERSAAGREAKMTEDGQVGISFKGLPRDLVFDPRCGVRWYTEEELAKEGMRYPNALEFKHSGARLMPNVTEPTTQPGAEIFNPAPRDAYFSGIQDISMQAPREELSMKAEYTFPLYEGSPARPLKYDPANPVLGTKSGDGSVVGHQVVRGGDGAVLMTWVPTDAPSDGKAPDPALEPRREERDSALNQRLHEAARNLGNITELGISGRVELPKSED
jgi:hypothetical protein